MTTGITREPFFSDLMYPDDQFYPDCRKTFLQNYRGKCESGLYHYHILDEGGTYIIFMNYLQFN